MTTSASRPIEVLCVIICHLLRYIVRMASVAKEGSFE
jgi:hypothetical protein